jgi:hypothetical protein
MTGESVPAVDASAVSKRMKDYATIPVHQQKAVCLAYSVGILTGMPDGNFHPEGILSRAEAVAVIRRVIDPSARIQVGDDPADATDDVDSDAASGVSSEVWSDEEFQAFMASDEWKNYLNPNTIAGMEDGVLLFYDFIPATTSSLSGPDRFPYKLEEPLYSKYYELAKTLGYHAKKLGGKATVSYTEYLGGSVEFDKSDIGGWIGAAPDLCFTVRHDRISRFAPDFPQYFPGHLLNEIDSIWEFDSFYSVLEFNDAYRNGSLTAFDYSQEKYVTVLQAVANIYLGETQAKGLVEYMVNKHDQFITSGRNGESTEINKLHDGMILYSVFPRYTGQDTVFLNAGEFK